MFICSVVQLFDTLKLHTKKGCILDKKIISIMFTENMGIKIFKDINYPNALYTTKFYHSIKEIDYEKA